MRRITLSIYFHDMGMLVTKDEYKNRNQSAFRKFREEVLAGNEGSPDYVARIHWNTVSRTLSVTDNGTGMTQEIIKNHLLRVGSSRYQDPSFKEKTPTFSPISRFGIGVLSAFMISDDVEITTCSAEDDLARRIALRSVHGRYLIRTLDKFTAPEARALLPHGTCVRLRVRPSARLLDILALARRWIVMPACSVTVQVDSEAPVSIGFGSPKEALEDYLNNTGTISNLGGQQKVRVIERSIRGLTLAYAVRWSDTYKDWSMMNVSDRHVSSYTIPSTCIEGIAVEFATPGLRTRKLLAVANATGKDAPKTNVARSNLETTPEQEEMTSALYGIYLEHVTDEIKRLRNEGHYSLTWAVNNSTTLVYPLVGEKGAAVLPSKLYERIYDLPIFLIEKGGKREAVTFNELKKAESFWTIESALIRSSEHLVKETSGNSSVSALVQALADPAVALPDGMYLSNFEGATFIRDVIEEECEPRELKVNDTYRRCDLLWKIVGEKRNWLRMSEVIAKANMQPSARFRNVIGYSGEILFQRTQSYRRFSVGQLWVPTVDVPSSGMDDYGAAVFAYRIFLRSGTAATKFLVAASKGIEGEEEFASFVLYAAILLNTLSLNTSVENAVSSANSMVKRATADLGGAILKDSEKFLESIAAGPTRLFDANAWSSRVVNLTN